MSRCYQEYDLSDEAWNWLNDNCQKEQSDPCPHCGKPTKTRLKVIETRHEDHFYGDGPDYNTYLTNDGKKITEVQQEEPWNCGPCHFKCLQDENGNKFAYWPQEAIDIMCGMTE